MSASAAGVHVTDTTTPVCTGTLASPSFAPPSRAASVAASVTASVTVSVAASAV
jgi:hypothetical protein